NISIFGTSIGTSTNSKGLFSIEYSGKSPVRIICSHLSYSSFDTLIYFEGKKQIFLNIQLQKKDKELATINITDKSSAEAGITKLSPKILNNIPQVSGNSIQTMIKTLPGVAAVNEMSSSYSVRGGNFDENLVYINGFEIYRPILVQAGKQEGLDMANADLVSSVNFSAGGFAAQYGDKMSSVLDIKYKKPAQFKASANLGLLGAAAHVEGSSKNNKFSYLAGLRYKNSQYLLNSLETKGEYKPNFFDFQNNFEYKISEKWTVALLVYFANNNYLFYPEDRSTSFGTTKDAVNLYVDFEGGEKDRFTSFLGGLSTNFKVNKLLSMELKASAYADYEELKYDIKGRYSLNELDKQIGSETFGDSILNLGIGSFIKHARNYFEAQIYNIEYKLNYVLNKQHVQLGLKYQNEQINDQINEWQMKDSAGYSIPYNGQQILLSNAYRSNNQIKSNRYSAFIQADYHGNGAIRWNMVYGLRWQYWDFNQKTLISPRIAGGFYPNAKQKLYLRFSTGVYYQSLFYKEIINYKGDVFQDINSPRSIHFSVSGDYDFSIFNRPFHFKTELYYKLIEHIIPYSIDNIRVLYYPEKTAGGFVSGADFRLNGEFVPGVDSWLSFSLMKSRMQIENDTLGEQPFPNDHPVNISLFFQDYVPGNNRFRVNLALMYLSGLPFGPPLEETYYAPLRMPSYFRVDLGFSAELKKENQLNKSAFLNKFSYVRLGLDVFNLLGINNTISYNWITVVPNSSNLGGLQATEFAVPNYLSNRRVNLSLSIGF
ncbi:MAG: TonB-dependent receptor, partial [Bacteroidales bacterium]|nr:TonB-dependent receptor [Bacteroidales bacterium]